MTHPQEHDQLPTTLRAVEDELALRLRDACSKVRVSEESTGELMRLEDTLLDAARAAKQAVSVRRRLRSRAEAARDALAQPVASGSDAFTDGADPVAVSDVAVRNLVDPSGLEWQVWEVSPSVLTRTGAVLSDYREGWLAFESVDGVRHRRLPGFPREWTKLSNLELEALLDRADEVKRKPRTRLARRPDVADTVADVASEAASDDAPPDEATPGA
jgi:hypothetical protein